MDLHKYTFVGPNHYASLLGNYVTQVCVQYKRNRLNKFGEQDRFLIKLYYFTLFFRKIVRSGIFGIIITNSVILSKIDLVLQIYSNDYSYIV